MNPMEFTPIQGAILAIASIVLVIQMFALMHDGKTRYIKLMCILLTLDFLAFYGWLLITSPYNRDDSFLWSQLLRLHTMLTLGQMSVYEYLRDKDGQRR